jgi:hypothetical protein
MQSGGTKADLWESLDTFDAAIDWLGKWTQEDPSRILRMRGLVTAEQKQSLSSYGSIEHIWP